MQHNNKKVKTKLLRASKNGSLNKVAYLFVCVLLESMNNQYRLSFLRLRRLISSGQLGLVWSTIGFSSTLFLRKFEKELFKINFKLNISL